MYVPTGSMRGCTGVTHFPNIYLCMHRLHVCRFVRCQLPLRHAAGLCRSVPGIVVHGVRPALMLVLRSHQRGGMQGTRPIACHGCRGLRILHTWEHARLYRCHIFPKYVPTACRSICELSVAAPTCGRVVSVCSCASRAWSPASAAASSPLASLRRDTRHQTYVLPTAVVRCGSCRWGRWRRPQRYYDCERCCGLLPRRDVAAAVAAAFL